MKSNKQLQLAFDFVQLTNRNIFLTGKAGTGKTTFLRNLKEMLPKRMIVVAPTGVAAINAGGVTIHSFFQLSFGPQMGQESEQNRQMRFNKEKISIIRSLDLLVIDEISMVRADILDAIDRVMRRFKNRRKPFGGAQLLMIGDLQQLAPIVKREEWELLKTAYQTAYFFSSKALKQTPYVSIELTQVFRQQDDKFISILNKVRDNILDEATRNELNSRYDPGFNPDDDEGYITLCTHNAQAHRINDSKLKELPSEAKVFTARVEGNFPEYSFPTNYELCLKIGAQVMFVKNDPDPEKRFFNGKIGQVTDFDESSIFVQCPGDNEEIEVATLLWENVKYTIDKDTAEIKEEVEGSFSQVPLKLAWAITIHKSQGLTFERAIIDAEASFAHGQVYVALSRCKTLEGLVLKTPIQKYSIITDETVDGFIQKVEQNQPGEKELKDAQMGFQREQLSELFSFYRAVYLVNSIGKIMDENPGSFTEVFVGSYRQLRDGLRNSLADVGDKFQQQIDKYLQHEPDAEKNQNLQERIKKAADYFYKNVKIILLDGVEQAEWEIDNRTVKKKVFHRLSDLADEAKIKLAAYEVCREGFSVKGIMEARAKAMVEGSMPKPKIQKVKEVINKELIPHPELYKLLRTWRNEQATELGLPAYMVFSQKSLIEMVNYLPVEVKTLKMINGMGSKKVSQFGKDILEIVQEYCEENNVERMDLPLKEAREKTVKPKDDTKKISFDLFNEGKNIKEVAKHRGLAESTVEAHLGFYAEKGELDITRILSQEKLDSILNYYRETDNISLSVARENLGENYSYGELRMGLSYYLFLKGNGWNKDS